jgi:hypothetical protein
MNVIAPITAADPVNGFDALDALDKFLDPWDAPGWREAALDYHKKRGRAACEVWLAPEDAARLRRLMDDDVSIERAWRVLDGCRARDAVPETTVEALMFALRRGVRVLSEPDTARRLVQLDDAQLREVATRLQKLKPHIASDWTPADVQVLLTIRGEINGQNTR